MKLLNQNEKSAQIAVTSVLIFLVCFACLNLFNSNGAQPNQRSSLLPLILNATEPFLITGNIQRLQPELEQLILGTSVERLDIHGADSLALASVRNLDVNLPAQASLYEFSDAIVLDDALAATIILQEHLETPVQPTWPNLLISFACALAAAIGLLFLNTIQSNSIRPIQSGRPQAEPVDAESTEHKDTTTEETSDFVEPPPISIEPKGHQRLIMLIRLSDMRDHLVRADEIDLYMTHIWRITERMAETYGISCVGVQSGCLVFTASGTNNAVALRHSIMFGWNLCRIEGRPENSRSNVPASLISPIDFMGDNPCHALALATNEALIEVQEQLELLPTGEFRICESLKDYLPKSVDAIQADNRTLRILSIESRMLDLWKQQTQLK